MISIVIPVFNSAPYIVECLDSIATQTYSDLEVILVDDCSTDDSIVLARNFITNYSGRIQFKIISHSQNRGASAAKNTGLSTACGEYVSFIDSDDYISPNMYERLLSEIENNGNNVGIVLCYYYILSHGRKIKPLDAPKEKYIIPSEDFARQFLLMNVPFANWGKLFKREILFNFKFREGRINEDYMSAFDYYQEIEDKQINTVVIPDRLYYYRMNENSVIHSTPNIYSIVFNDWDEILSKIRYDKPDLYSILEEKYIHDVCQRAFETRLDSNGLHYEYAALLRRLHKIPIYKAYQALELKSFGVFLCLKYFHKIYEVIKRKSY